MKEFILTNCRVIDPARGIDRKTSIGVSAGKIVKTSEIKKAPKINLKGKVVAPGFIDLHVHLRQPGATHKETIATGTRAAAAGGFTTIVAMPNTSPVTDTPGTIEYIRRHAEREGVVKILPCGALTKGLDGEQIAGVGSLKKAGVVALSDDGKCVQNHDIMRHIVEYSKTFQLPILDHCQDNILFGDGVMHEGKWSTLLGLRSIPAAAEELMVARDIILAELADWKIHIQHVSTANSVRRIKEAQRRKIPITGEVTPHHITLDDELIKHFDSVHKMNPPLRSGEHRKALIRGLKDGTISVIATDHAPHSETEKMVEFDYAPFGVIGLETAVPVCLNELYHKKVLDLPQLIAKFTAGPAAVLGLDIGTLAPGQAADITILDLNSKHVIDKEQFYSKSRNTPFHGWETRGKVAATIVDGKFIYSKLTDCRGKI